MEGIFYIYEDAKLNGKGNLKGPVFSVELLGDATMLTLRMVLTFVIRWKVQKDYKSKINKRSFYLKNKIFVTWVHLRYR